MGDIQPTGKDEMCWKDQAGTRNMIRCSSFSGKKKIKINNAWMYTLLRTRRQILKSEYKNSLLDCTIYRLVTYVCFLKVPKNFIFTSSKCMCCFPERKLFNDISQRYPLHSSYTWYKMTYKNLDTFKPTGFWSHLN